MSSRLNTYTKRVKRLQKFLLLIGVVISMTQSLAQSLNIQLNEGDAAFLPALKDSYGQSVNLADVAAGQWLVLWFYPKALTSGCSLQAKRYSDLTFDLEAANVRAFGISHDNAEEQCEFIESMKLSGQMLPDTDGALAAAYGVSGVFYNRDTVLINPEGKIEKIWRSVNPVDDADRVLEYVRSQ
jgi:thioredoxin-dependent peroxiredoxin